MSELSQRVDELLAAVVAFDPVLWPGGDCAAFAEQFARAAKVFEAASTRVAVRASRCGRMGERPADFLARVHGTTLGAARAAIDVVERNLPATRDAVVAGQVSIAQAAAIVSVPEHERELLAVARSKGLGPVKDLARKCRLAGIDPDVLHGRQVAAQRFRSWQNDIGNIAFEGELPPEVGVRFVNRLGAESDRLWRAAAKDDRSRPREWHAAQAFAQMVDGNGRGTTVRSGRADVVIVCDIAAYRRGRVAPGEVCHIIGGGPIPVPVARELAKDAFLKAVLHDGTAIHTVAHFGRHRPAALQTALDLGAAPDFDGVTCTDCDSRYFLEWDHVNPVANRGVTSFANLEARCPRCHDAKTERDRRAGLLRAGRGP